MGHVIAAIGGINAFFRPLIAFIAPIWVIIFLNDLSIIFRDKNAHNFNQGMMEFLNYSLQLLEI
jgi:hypothetical protein